MSIKIERIRTTPEGVKLIAISRVIDFKKCKPQVSPCWFADYTPDSTGGVVRIFKQGAEIAFHVPNFTAALRGIRNTK